MTSNRGHHGGRHRNRRVVTHSIGPEVIRWWLDCFLEPVVATSASCYKACGRKKGSISMVYLAVVRRIRRLEVVRQCVTIDIVASWVPGDDEEHGGLVGS